MPRRNALALAVCLAAAFTTLLDQASLNTTVPALRESLGAGPATLQWIIAGYSLAFGLAMVPAGRLGDAHGRKWFFVAGIALYTVAGVVAATANEAWVVAVARLAQGAGAGIINPQVYGIIQDLFTGRDRAWALGAYSTVGGIAAVLGPLTGGLALGAFGDDLGWRVVLLMGVPFGLLTVPLAIRFLPAGRPDHGRRTTLDLPGLALLGAVTLCLLLPFVLPGDQGLPVAVWPLAAVTALAALAWWERRYARSGRTPVLMPELVRSRGFSLGTLTAMFQFGATLSANLVLVLYLQEGLGWPALEAALPLIPGAIGFAAASSQSWRLVARFGRSAVVGALAGAVTTTATTIVVLHTVPESGLGVALMCTQFASGVCGGLVLSPNQALTLAHAPAGAAGLAGAFLQVSQRISATLAMAAVTGIMVTGQNVTAALAICLTMMTASAACAALDLRTRPTAPRPTVPPVPATETR
ncbi:MFS transporter [Actinoplanes lobatus]|uniref:MFS family permease n=1 Tax=Actinoplanes lobatus TaxID=113568 RepID=A0A7W7HNK3_9ACTN|nr:MFS transporter [Actinoplanes lobatus]MBB4753806.1 MFS family permease [Actinoplanes lobatus]GGN72465.1 MFS transporter [Actinoplanes lobatus]GIE42041.1 MFS transporter [Actinoplanes lobatus]